MSSYYLDTSVALRILLGHSPAAASWFDSATGSTTPVISSRILRTELTRALRRLGLPVSRRDAILDYVSTVPLDEAVLHEAETIVPNLKTLDAIHLAAALRTGLADIVICTHDQKMGEVAKLLGLKTLDPVTDDD